MDIRSLYLSYSEKLKDKKEFNFWKILFKYIKEYKIKEHIISYVIMFVVVLSFIAFIFCSRITFLSSMVLGIILFLITFAVFLSVNKKKIQNDLLKSYEKFSDIRRLILFHLLKDENKDIENLTRIKSKIEEIKEELNIFSYPIKIKSIAGYMTLGSIIVYGNFIMETLRFYCEKKLGDNPTIYNLIHFFLISFLILLLIISIITIIGLFITMYSFINLRHYDYLIKDLDNAIRFNDNFKNLSNQIIIEE
ncbi:hypothetical protein FNSP4_12240 [Fusobacterium nucleatum]|nr:hypothetical protein FNCP4_06290 [Fusobacterium nucleatum]BEP03490.1 hypothetical protein FNSP4_12240 [Fusobacterium nucleatum]